MYPPRFDYLAPTSVEEVVEALGERGGDAKVMPLTPDKVWDAMKEAGLAE